MKKFFLPIVLISFCIFICGCTPKNPTNTDTQITTDTVEVISWDSETLSQTIDDENNDKNNEIVTNETNDENNETSNIAQDTETVNDDTISTTGEKLSTDEIIDKLTEYGKSWDFDEEWVDILYQIIDSLSE